MDKREQCCGRHHIDLSRIRRIVFSVTNEEPKECIHMTMRGRRPLGLVLDSIINEDSGTGTTRLGTMAHSRSICMYRTSRCVKVKVFAFLSNQEEES
jgi:hypothetical protein